MLGGFQAGYMIEGKPKPDPGKGPSTDNSRVTPGVMQAMGIPLLQGRYFTDADNETSESVCIVDITMAQTEWPGQNPIGKHVSVSVTP